MLGMTISTNVSFFGDWLVATVAYNLIWSIDRFSFNYIISKLISIVKTLKHLKTIIDNIRKWIYKSHSWDRREILFPEDRLQSRWRIVTIVINFSSWIYTCYFHSLSYFPKLYFLHASNYHLDERFWPYSFFLPLNSENFLNIKR